MEQYIHKDALIAEIEKLKEMYCYDTKTNASFVAESVINSINNAINSIEVKEMDLQEEPKADWLQELQDKIDSLSKEDFEKVMAKYSRYGEEGSIDYDKLNTMLDESLSTETKESWNERLGEEPVSEDLEEAANFYADTHTEWFDADNNPHVSPAFKAGAKWQKAHLLKPADGDDLPEIDREVIALLDNGKVAFGHRPPEYWDGKNIITGEVTRYYPKTYDKGGWNIPDTKYWLDVELPKEIEL